MSKTAKIVWWVVGVVVVVGLVWWGITKNNGSGNVIKIGVFGPFTGDASTYGEPFEKTVELAIGQINAAGGVNGKQIQAIYEDDQCTGDLAANAVQKLVNVDGVQAVLGSMCSGATIPSVPIAAASHVLIFSPGASSPKLTGISPYFFRDYPSDASQAAIYADVGYHQKGWRTVAVMEEQTDYATALGGAFSKDFESYGGKVVVQEFPSTATDLRSMVTTLKQQKPDALFIDTQSPATAQETLNAMAQLSWKPALIIDDTLEGDSATMQKDASQLEGAITAEFLQNASDTAFQSFVNAYQTKYGETLPYQNYGQTEYDAVYLLADGIKAVGYNGQALAAWSRTIKDWKGVSGLDHYWFRRRQGRRRRASSDP